MTTTTAVRTEACTRKGCWRQEDHRPHDSEYPAHRRFVDRAEPQGVWPNCPPYWHLVLEAVDDGPWEVKLQVVGPTGPLPHRTYGGVPVPFPQHTTLAEPEHLLDALQRASEIRDELNAKAGLR